MEVGTLTPDLIKILQNKKVIPVASDLTQTMKKDSSVVGLMI